MRLHLLDYALWFAAPTPQLGVWVAMYRRGFYRQYPWFFNYIVFQTLSAPILVVIWFQSSEYYYAYFTETALSALLSFAILQDLLKNGFQTSRTVEKLCGFLLVATLVILVATELPAIYTNRWDLQDTLTQLIYLGYRTALVSQFGMMILLFVLRRRLGIARHNLVFGITLGLGLFATVNMLMVMRVVYPGFSGRTWSRINSIAYLLSCGIWLAYALAGSGREHAYSWKRVVPS
jgi:hypothetical protein